MIIAQLSTSVLASAALGMVYLLYNWYARRVQQLQFMHANGCKKAHLYYPFKEPFLGLDMLYGIIAAAREKKLLDFFQGLLEKHGSTYMTQVLLRPTGAVWTSDPENAKAVFTTKFTDWSVAPGRKALKFALGESIIMTDGRAWSHSRALLRPIFTKDNIADLELLEHHVQALLKHIPKDGTTVDLQPLFHSLSLDAATEFVFGQSMHILSSAQSDMQMQLHEDFEVVMQDVVDRARYGVMYPLFRKKHALTAVLNVKSRAESYSSEALRRRVDTGSNEKGDAVTEVRNGYSFLDELAKQTGDAAKMRDEALTLLFAGRDTTAAVLNFLWYLLARNPAVWSELVSEVDQLQGALPTYESIKQAKYLRFCERETMRLFPSIPLFPPRVSNKDTVLPVGGGSDGTAPMFVPKGTQFLFNQWAMNHRQDIWGVDADQFRPSRWESLTPGWIGKNYLPFGGGPRICIGQEFALTEVYYVTIRLVQHFRRIESRDPNPWVEKFTTTIGSHSGVLVALMAQAEVAIVQNKKSQNRSHTKVTGSDVGYEVSSFSILRSWVHKVEHKYK